MRLFSRPRMGTRHSGARDASAANSSASGEPDGRTSHGFPRRASSTNTGALAASVSSGAGSVPEIGGQRSLPDSR